MERVAVESRFVLSSPMFAIATSNRGGSVVGIVPEGYGAITRNVGSSIENGRQAGLFVCGQVFARLPERRLCFGGKAYQMPYPADVDPEVVDPDKLYLHGIDYLYTFSVVSSSDTHICYERSREALPESYLFPHRLRVTYTNDRDGFVIHIVIDQVEKATPVNPLVHPFFKYYYNEINGNPLSLQARLSHCFEYPADAPYPMSVGRPTVLSAAGPYAEKRVLAQDLDHSFISEDGVAVLDWKNGPTIRMEDLTEQSHSAIRGLQIWTTAAEERNLCGVEQGGPSNVFNLVDDGQLPTDWMMVVEPGGRCERKVRYTLLS